MAGWGVGKSVEDLIRTFGEEHGLSPRELEVLARMAAGLCTKEIATAMGCAYSTVVVFKRRILSKTKLTSSTAMLPMLLATAASDDGRMREVLDTRGSVAIAAIEGSAQEGGPRDTLGPRPRRSDPR
jgi:DNA-binding CsgD family transcriptional regulator